MSRAAWIWSWLTLASFGGGEVAVPDMSWVPDGWTAARAEGVELPTMTAWVLEDGGPRARGVLRTQTTTYEGMAAFRLAMASTSATDAASQARLACLLVDPDGAGRTPWTRDKDGLSAELVELVEAPKLEDGEIVYWRRHGQLDDMLRVRIGLDGSLRGTELASALSEARAATQDAIVRATEGMQAWDYSGRVSALTQLASSGDPRAGAFLLDAARTQADWRVREAAVHHLRAIPVANRTESLVSILEQDTHEKVRRAAARTLGELGDRGAAEALALARTADSSPLVRAAAIEALGKLAR